MAPVSSEPLQSTKGPTISVSAVNISPASLALRAVAAEDPAKIALEIDERRISYGEFNEQADRLAQSLVGEFGAGAERVALRAGGTHELAVGFLGIQRAGMVVIPVDPTAPLERVATILADVEPCVLLSDVAGDAGAALSVPVVDPLTFGADGEAIPIDRDRGEIVSIVYTSGSTGVPKGIMVGRDQRNMLVNRLSEYRVPIGGRVGVFAAGTVGYIDPLVSGVLVLRGTLAAYEIRRRGLAGLGEWLADSELSAFSVVPTMLRHLLSTLSPELCLSSVRSVTLSGETATWDDVRGLRRHLSPEAVIINAFGLTETSAIASLIIPSDMPTGDGPLPAGRVLPGVDLAILDPQGQPVPPGGAGEIVVSSRTVSLGYWRRPDLTRAAFRELADGRREVRTGDGGRLLPDGTLEHLGRVDHMVKISGNRVELGEVEHALTRLDAVSAAAAAPYTDDTRNTRLTACVVPVAGRRVEARALRAALSRRLPGYMIPDRITVVDALPQLPGGKVDRGRIAELGVSDSLRREASVPGGSALERSLGTIWREILQRESIDRHDDFFRIGGDSMRAARMFVELDRRLGIDRPVSLLAEAPTIATLALMLSDDDYSVWDSLLAVQTDGTRPPLFVVHDGGGSLLYARGLAAELGTDQPVYGLRCAGLDGTPPREQSLEALAATYVHRIQALYPSGPYLLYGASLGGLIAFEIARQLLQGGNEVPLVVLGDATAPGPLRLPLTRGERHAFGRRDPEPGNLAGWMRYLLLLARSYVEYHRGWVNPAVRTARREDRLIKRARRRGDPIPVSLRSQYALREYGRLSFDYDPRSPFPERVLLLRAEGPRDSPDRGWGRLLGHGLDIVDVPGTHIELCREASAAYVAPILTDAIERQLRQTPPAELISQS